MLFCCPHHGSCKIHWDARIFLAAYMKVDYFNLLFIDYTGCITVCGWKVFFCKNKYSLSGQNDNGETCACIKGSTCRTLTIVSHVLPWYFFSFVNVAHSQLLHLRLTILFKDTTMRNIKNIIRARRILYRESIIVSLFLFLLGCSTAYFQPQ